MSGPLLPLADSIADVERRVRAALTAPRGVLCAWCTAKNPLPADPRAVYLGEIWHPADRPHKVGLG